MQPQFLETFKGLTVAQAAAISGALARTSDVYTAPKKITGQSLFTACNVAKIDQAEVITAMSSESGDTAISAMEHLTGGKIDVKPAGKKSRKVKRKPPMADNRILVEYIANPKRNGCAAWTRYNLYKVGMSVDQAVASGIKRADIAWDSARDFIKLQQPDSKAAKEAVKKFAST